MDAELGNYEGFLNSGIMKNWDGSETGINVKYFGLVQFDSTKSVAFKLNICTVFHNGFCDPLGFMKSI